MGWDSVERRRGRRVEVGAPLAIRPMGHAESGSVKEQATTNLSLAGVYFETDDEQPYAINDAFMISVAIPEAQRRDFPFARLAGPGRVVRVTTLPERGLGGKGRLGVALEFGANTTALTATPPRG